MELTFLGRGAGFNPAEKNTSAYFIEKDEMFLIDCGESVFATLLERKILDGISAFNVFITLRTSAFGFGVIKEMRFYRKTLARA